jgi:hypothetical protein
LYWANGCSYFNVAEGDGSGISSLRVRLCCLDASLMGVRVAPFSGGNCITTTE